MVNTPGGVIRARSGQGEEQEVFRGESDELSFLNPLQDDSTRDDAEAKNDFWSITGCFTYRYHVESRVKLYMPKEESFSMDDYWNVDGDRELSDKNHNIARKTTKRVYVVQEETDKKTNDFQARQFMARNVETHVGCV